MPKSQDTLSATDDTRLLEIQEIPAPKDLITWFKLSPNGEKFVTENRQASANIIHGNDDRLIAIV